MVPQHDRARKVRPGRDEHLGAAADRRVDRLGVERRLAKSTVEISVYFTSEQFLWARIFISVSYYWGGSWNSRFESELVDKYVHSKS